MHFIFPRQPLVSILVLPRWSRPLVRLKGRSVKMSACLHVVDVTQLLVSHDHHLLYSSVSSSALERDFLRLSVRPVRSMTKTLCVSAAVRSFPGVISPAQGNWILGRLKDSNSLCVTQIFWRLINTRATREEINSRTPRILCLFTRCAFPHADNDSLNTRNGLVWLEETNKRRYESK